MSHQSDLCPMMVQTEWSGRRWCCEDLTWSGMAPQVEVAVPRHFFTLLWNVSYDTRGIMRGKLRTRRRCTCPLWGLLFFFLSPLLFSMFLSFIVMRVKYSLYGQMDGTGWRRGCSWPQWHFRAPPPGPNQKISLKILPAHRGWHLAAIRVFLLFTAFLSALSGEMGEKGIRDGETLRERVPILQTR